MRASFGFKPRTIIIVALLLITGFGSKTVSAQGTIVAPGGDNVKTNTANGLSTVTFTLEQGDITVNLPDDIRAGDTISGLVEAHPKGSTDEEKTKNYGELKGVVMDLSGTKFKVDDWMFTWTVPMTQPNAPVEYRLKIAGILGNPTPATQPGAVIALNPSTTGPPKLSWGEYDVVSPGQTGRPITITGRFDGRSRNTDLTLRTARGSEMRLTKMAESSRGKLVFRSPTSTTTIGVNKITIGEIEEKYTTLDYRNLGVNLNAPETTLRKGQETSLTVLVAGLKGITAPVTLTLQSTGVITMQGGMNQTLVIQPSEVGEDGTYSTTRRITGVRAGGWSASATVVGGRSK